MADITTTNDASEFEKRMLIRNLLGEAWMMCNECGAKLWSFDGSQDADRKCPYRNRFGNCEPKGEIR